MDPGYTKRFVSSSMGEPDATGREDDSTEQAEGPLMSRRAAIAGVGMGALAVLGFVVGAGTGGPVSVDETLTAEVSALRDEIKTVQTQTEGLPSAIDADRGLVLAQGSAQDVATLQNDYSHLAPKIAAAGGDPGGLTANTRRGLTPYFAPSVDQSLLEPWYLLASDKDVANGLGIPMSFKSGAQWVAQRPYLVKVDGTIPVTWLAYETHSAEGQEPAVLAWASANYDMTRRTFIDVTTGTTTTGQALRLEVKTP
jgi:hypothetical protein